MSTAAGHREVVLDHAARPRRAGLREPFDAEATAANPVCGDRVVVRVALDRERVADLSWTGLGCTVSQASASVMSELVVGRTAGEALALLRRFQGLLARAARPGSTGGPLEGRGGEDGEVDDGHPDDDSEALGDAVAFAGAGRYPARVRCALLGWSALADALARAAPPTS